MARRNPNRTRRDCSRAVAHILTKQSKNERIFNLKMNIGLFMLSMLVNLMLSWSTQSPAARCTLAVGNPSRHVYIEIQRTRPIGPEMR